MIFKKIIHPTVAPYSEISGDDFWTKKPSFPFCLRFKIVSLLLNEFTFDNLNWHLEFAV